MRSEGALTETSTVSLFAVCSQFVSSRCGLSWYKGVILDVLRQAKYVLWKLHSLVLALTGGSFIPNIRKRSLLASTPTRFRTSTFARFQLIVLVCCLSAVCRQRRRVQRAATPANLCD